MNWRRVICASLLAASFAWAQQIKLYLKDGTYQLAREYKVDKDRVRYYSTERADWEELPTDLVDLAKTEAEHKSRQEADRKEAAMNDAEEKFEREQAAEVARIPQNAGVYMVANNKLETLKQADLKVVNNKRRSVLKAMAPIPVVSGKSSVEIDGEHSSFVVTDPKPMFYFRLAQTERFGIQKMGEKKGVRVVETWNIVPVTKEIVPDRKPIEIFRQQFQDGLYKIWPTQPLEPGEYAVVEYTEGDGSLQVWDFRFAAAASATPAP